MSDSNQLFPVALLVAEKAHRGQVYRGYGGREDEPYILHPMRVVARVSQAAYVVAILHDAREDGGLTRYPNWLYAEEVAALDALTRDKARETYEDYIRRVGAAGTLAVEVKVADLRDNLANHPPERLRERYEAALAALAPQEGA